jgi:putative FmdB family regulatory protein
VPTYGYRCSGCGAEFDVWQKMSDPPGATCPTCGAGARRVFFPAGIVFKGSGFYATDSRKASSASSSNGKGSALSKDTTPKTDAAGSGGTATPAKDTTT